MPVFPHRTLLRHGLEAGHAPVAAASDRDQACGRRGDGLQGVAPASSERIAGCLEEPLNLPEIIMVQHHGIAGGSVHLLT